MWPSSTTTSRGIRYGFEQRIGRIDRIGQLYDEVTIRNYSYKDTVETDIYARLDDRIDLFENVVGKMQSIPSGVSQQIRAAH